MVGVELCAAAIENAKINAAVNQLSERVTFINSEAEAVMKQILKDTTGRWSPLVRL